MSFGHVMIISKMCVVSTSAIFGTHTFQCVCVSILHNEYMLYECVCVGLCQVMRVCTMAAVSLRVYVCASAT